MKIIELPGLMRTENNSEYHSNPALSFTGLKTFIKSPELFDKKQRGELEEEHKDEWDIGSAIHERILEPDRMPEYRLVSKYYNGAKKSGKKFKKKLDALGITLLNAKNSQIVRDCVSSLKDKPLMALLDPAHGEPELSWRIGADGFSVQCRSDWFCWSAPAGLEEFGIQEKARYVVDLKSCRDLDDWFSDSKWKNPLINDLLYAGQEKWYLDIINNVLKSGRRRGVDEWLFVVVEKKEPFRCAVIRTPDNARNCASNIVRHALGDLFSRMESGDWKDARTVGVYEPEISI